ncbi:hypothetical protein [Paraferrimonas sedimenticola]|uniref:PorT family protein n=1 Tax=Paraferrimonas sedimenticola TaxID=375674 RepID=A0AA37W0H5_9GAMM|nr:hypothetical protein [Paraferrimonas sedimenticola]GLP96355.1 hypothetical protein GCM10007895_16610 [Paraferrimonas sedimenticola]
MSYAKYLLAFSIGAMVSAPSFAQEEDINYGDPTASFKTFGVSVSNKNSAQANLMLGFGKHILQADLTSQ